MKSLLAAITALLPLSVTAGLPLKVELITPGKPVVISTKDLAAAASLANAAEELRGLRKGGRLEAPELKEMQELEKRLAEGRNLKQGVPLTLRFSNPTNKPVTFSYGADVSTNLLTVTGPAAVKLPYQGMMTTEFRQPNPTTIPAGGRKDFPISELAYGARDMSRWLVGKPGTYTVVLEFVTRHEDAKVSLTSNKLTIEVKEGN